MKTKYIIAVIVVIVLGAVALWWFFYRTPAAVVIPTADSVVVQAVQTTDKAQGAASASIDQANPFHTNVNPVGGYKNPFE